MANIFTSSIGKKLIMSISGLFLILFLTVHLVANSTFLFSEEAFETACEIMATPFVTVMVPVLAFGFVIHIIYATILTLYNRKARGNERYAIPHKGHADSWSAKNMFVLGIIVLGCLVFHLTHFWDDMQLQEFMGNEPVNPNTDSGAHSRQSAGTTTYGSNAGKQSEWCTYRYWYSDSSS